MTDGVALALSGVRGGFLGARWTRVTAKTGMPRTAATGSLCGAQGGAGRVLPLTSCSVPLKMFRFIKITMNQRFFVWAQ